MMTKRNIIMMMQRYVVEAQTIIQWENTDGCWEINTYLGHISYMFRLWENMYKSMFGDLNKLHCELLPEDFDVEYDEELFKDSFKSMIETIEVIRKLKEEIDIRLEWQEENRRKRKCQNQ
jgi:uncharacterized protein with von Willebrand factor type A (vWA) domain